MPKCSVKVDVGLVIIQARERFWFGRLSWDLQDLSESWKKELEGGSTDFELRPWMTNQQWERLVKQVHECRVKLAEV